MFSGRTYPVTRLSFSSRATCRRRRSSSVPSPLPWQDCQGKGLGTELLRRLLQVAREEKLSRVTGYVLPENMEMARVCEKLGFKLYRNADDPTLHAVYEL